MRRADRRAQNKPTLCNEPGKSRFGSCQLRWGMFTFNNRRLHCFRMAGLQKCKIRVRPFHHLGHWLNSTTRQGNISVLAKFCDAFLVTFLATLCALVDRLECMEGRRFHAFRCVQLSKVSQCRKEQSHKSQDKNLFFDYSKTERLRDWLSEW